MPSSPGGSLIPGGGCCHQGLASAERTEAGGRSQEAGWGGGAPIFPGQDEGDECAEREGEEGSLEKGGCSSWTWGGAEGRGDSPVRNLQGRG